MNALSHPKTNRQRIMYLGTGGLVMTLSLVGFLLIAHPAYAGIGISVAPNFPAAVTAGTTGQAVSMTITNGSTADVGTITLDGIFLTPSCGDTSSPTCTTPDPGVFAVSATGTGADACTGINFTNAIVDAGTGKVQFTPSAPIDLALGQTCTINFTVDVLKVPVHDANGGVTGVQTFQIGAIAAHDTDVPSLPGTGTGTDQTTVNPATPSIATTLSSAGPIAIGASIHDSATLTGATANAGGTVKYSAYAGANTCTGTDLLNSTVNVTNGVVPNSSNISFANAGTYSFQATYSGDANNTGPVSSVCSTEQIVVSPATPSIATTLSATTVDVGTAVHDSATLTGATATAGGTVKYSAYAGANTCTGTDLLNSTVNVTNGVVPNSADFTPTTPGTYSFQATYSGDANNTGPVSSACETEQLVVNQPQVATRTLGFWQTHTAFTESIFNGESGGSVTLGGMVINSDAKLFGGFLAGISKTTTGTKRSALDQARMQLAQQWLAAELNCEAFGCPQSTLDLLAKASTDFSGTDAGVILADASLLDTYNNSGDLIPSNLNQGSATPADSKAIADLAFWNNLN